MQPLSEEVSLSPWEAFAALHSLPSVLFLDSALRVPQLGRYSYVTADPFLTFRGRGRHLERIEGVARTLKDTAAFLPFLATELGKYQNEPLPGLPPFQGGLAGLFSYDLGRQFERLPGPRLDEFRTPDLAVGFYDWVFAHDHEAGRSWLISTGFPEVESERRRARAAERLSWVRRRLSEPAPNRAPQQASTPIALSPLHALERLPGLASNFSRRDFEAAVGRAIEYIHAGDCFQINLAQRLVVPEREPPFELYRRLRERNPATFGGYFDLGDFVIASASPERFLTTSPEGEVETRPIKGTRPRGRTAGEDARLAEELRHSAKDRAENIMIVDLLRNDLGRVCEYGSIDVPALCEVETYETVHHLVSQVRGRLRKDQKPLDLLRAAFPGGSVTGAPKIRAMEIIAELEPSARGPYCGSLGFISFTGAMDTNILIRTFTIGKGWVRFPVGGGIVADSDPRREYEETLHKAEGMLRALD